MEVYCDQICVLLMHGWLQEAERSSLSVSTLSVFSVHVLSWSSITLTGGKYGLGIQRQQLNKVQETTLQLHYHKLNLDLLLGCCIRL